MAAADHQQAHDQFLCSICLDVFTHPVTIPCGHNFCKNCITEHWNINHQNECPMCKKVFNTRPELNVNTFISEMVGQFRDKAAQEASSSSSQQQQESKPEEVLCDACSGPKLKALKSCLNCMTSFCETHLEPHLTASRLKRHQLIEPVENLEDRMCSEHDKPLELFCKTDQICVCKLCSLLDHKKHQFVPLRQEFEEKKAELGQKEAEIQQMIQKRQLKIQELKQSVDLSKESADRAIAEGVRVFTALIESAEKGKIQLIQTLTKEQKTTEQQAEALIAELEQEICELEKKSTEVEQLSRSEDHLHLIQRVPSVKIPPPTKDWTKVRVQKPLYERTVSKAVALLEETLSDEMKKLVQAELKRVQEYEVDVTLDPDTANYYLILSEDKKRVHNENKPKKLPDNPKRFMDCACVLAEQSFSSGRIYYEVQVQGKTDWDLGVARESINREENIPLDPEDGYWSIWLRDGLEYEALEDDPVCLCLKSRPEKVGVFVDYEEGLVSFYDVDSAALIHSFTNCCFTEKILPYFSPCNVDGDKNSAPLIITPVSRM